MRQLKEKERFANVKNEGGEDEKYHYHFYRGDDRK